MTPEPHEAADGRVGGDSKVRWIGLAVLGVLTLVLWAQPPFVTRQQLQWFDA